MLPRASGRPLRHVREQTSGRATSWSLMGSFCFRSAVWLRRLPFDVWPAQYCRDFSPEHERGGVLGFFSGASPMPAVLNISEEQASCPVSAALRHVCQNAG